MDLEKDWELLPLPFPHDEGFLEINDDGAGKKIYSRHPPGGIFSASGTTPSVFRMNYFICPPRSSPHQFIQVPRQPVPSDSESPQPIQDHHTNITSASTAAFDIDPVLAADHQDPAAVSQVFFKKMKEITESVDTMISSRGNVIEGAAVAAGANNFQFEERGDQPRKVDSVEIYVNSSSNMNQSADDVESEGEGEAGGWHLNSMWRWSLTTGVGAICSFGVAAAATLCVVIFSSNHGKNQKKLQFQIYTNKKRMKEAVHHHHHASKLNEAAISASSVPITTARITFGGYYDASL